MTIKTPILATALLGALAIATPALQAEVLAEWDFSDTYVLAPSQTASGMSADSTGFGSFGGVAQSGSYGRSGANDGTLFARVETLSGSPETVLGSTETYATTNNTYFEFTMTPDSEQAFSITSFSAEVFAQTISNNGGLSQAAYTIHYSLQSDVTGWGNELGSTTFDAPATTNQNGVTYDAEPFNVTLDSSFANISSEVNFRVYVWVETSDPSQYQSIRLDSVTFNGSAIPEASGSSMILGVAALIGLFFMRRRRK
ncbi:MAG: hypothetical protein ACQKBW_11890 [Puniceicoccales bacterium]